MELGDPPTLVGIAIAGMETATPSIPATIMYVQRSTSNTSIGVHAESPALFSSWETRLVKYF